MSNLEGTKTEKNLREAFAGESMARNKYNLFANVARKEGYELLAEYFDLTADNERQHAKQWLKRLDGIGDTKKNLNSGIEGEYWEWNSMYPRMAQEAREEGFQDIAAEFERVAKIEKEHDERYRKLLESLENDRLFHSEEAVEWQCRKCGFVATSKDAPQVCPVCGHPRGYFQRKSENY